MLASVTILLAAALVLVPLAKRLGLGSVLGYLLAGVLLGPFGFSLLPELSDMHQLSELGIVLLLFLVGLELDTQRLWSLRRSVFGVGAAQLLLTTVAAAAIAHFVAGIGHGAAIVLGIAAAMSSTAFVLPQLSERGEMTSRFGRLAFAILLFQDLAVIPTLALLPAVAGSPTLSGTATALAAAKALGAVLVVVVGGRYLARALFRWVGATKNHELFVATGLFLVLGTAFLLEQAGLSLTLGAFLAGVLLADSEYRHELRTSVEPFEGLLLGLFFLSVGVSANLGILFSGPLRVLALTAALLSGKAAILFAIGKIAKLETENALRLAFALPQGGEFAFVVLAAAARSGVLGQGLADEAILVVTLSMAASPFAFPIVDRIAGKCFSKKPEEEFDRIDQPASPVIVAGFGRVGQIVCRVLRATHVEFTALEKSAAQVDFVRRFGSKLYFGDATRVELLRSAGAAQAKLLVIAVEEKESSLEIARLAQRHFPNLRILARARNREHAYALMDLGIPYVMRETFASSLELATETLGELGYEKSLAAALVARFRRHDEDNLMEAYAVHTDEKALQKMGQQYTVELERLFEDDSRAFEQDDAKAKEKVGV